MPPYDASIAFAGPRDQGTFVLSNGAVAVHIETGKTVRVAAHAMELASRQPPAIAHVEPLERPVAYWLSWSPAAQ